MKLKSFLFAVCFSLFAQVFAATPHVHPKAADEAKKPASASLAYSNCFITVINNTNDIVDVFGQYDDGASLGFSIYGYEAPHTIDLYYSDWSWPFPYCHDGMYLRITSRFYGNLVYSGRALSNSTVYISYFNNNQVKAEVKAR